MRSTPLGISLLAAVLALTLPARAEEPAPPVEDPVRYLQLGDAKLGALSFAEAADAYASFALRAPDDPRAPLSLANAIVLQVRLGTVDELEREQDFFDKNYAPTNLALWAEEIFVVCGDFSRQGDHSAAEGCFSWVVSHNNRLASEARKKKGKVDPEDAQLFLEIEVRARARVARELVLQGELRIAEKEHSRLQAVIPKVGVWPNKKGPGKLARSPDTLDAIAESFFFSAEQKRLKAESITLEPYRGKGDRDSVLEYNKGTAAKWHEARSAAVEEAERAYARVLGIERPPPPPPPPPGGDPNAPLAPWGADSVEADNRDLPFPSPRWAVAAAERVGSLWSDLRELGMTLPIPREWKLPEPVSYAELRGTYGFLRDPMSDRMEDYRILAVHAFELCLRLSSEHQIVDEHSRACEAWLARHRGAEYHSLDELTRPPAFSAVGILTSPAPLLHDVASR